MEISIKILRCLIICCSFLLATADVSAQAEFIQNKGQWDSRVQYRADFSTGSFYLQNDGFTVVTHDPEDLKKVSDQMHGTGLLTKIGEPVILHSNAYKVNFLAGNTSPQNTAEKIQSYFTNYFIGADQSKWASGCKIAQAVSYKSIYPNIDLRYYSDAGKMKYDIIVHSGGDISKIAMKYSGIDKLEVKNRELVINTAVGVVKELYPYSYQAGETGRQTVNCRYSVNNNIVRFKVDNYDPASTLVIDPTLIFSTFTGSTADNWGYTATPGPDGRDRKSVV